MKHLRPNLQPDPPYSAHCRNCGALAELAYCPVCGQETRIGLPTVREFVGEFLRENLAIQGQLARTLVLLLLRPGQLTLDYVAGLRRRYVRPLRLYLGLSLVFFALIGGFDDVEIAVPEQEPTAESAPAAAAPDEPPEVAAPPIAAEPEPPPGGESSDLDQITINTGDAALDARLRARIDAFRALDDDTRNRQLADAFQRGAPAAMFVLMPLFALLLRLGYLFRGAPYALHLLFAINFHSFVFLLLLIARLPWPSPVDDLLMLLIPLHLWRGLLRVHGGGTKSTAVFALLILLIYSVLLGIGMGLVTVLPTALM